MKFVPCFPAAETFSVSPHESFTSHLTSPKPTPFAGAGCVGLREFGVYPHNSKAPWSFRQSLRNAASLNCPHASLSGVNKAS